MAEPAVQPPADATPAFKAGDPVWVLGKVVAAWPANPPEIPTGYQIRFEERIGSAYRPLPGSIVVAAPSLKPA